jgi:Inhibitor of Apoptosis domain
MAKAGFFQENPGTTTCFSCGESFDGWEENDDPLVKHLKLVPHCGWAIVASIHPRDSQPSEEYPLSAGIIEARKATFGNQWPHQNKKGWKCKITQVFIITIHLRIILIQVAGFGRLDTHAYS